MKIKKTLIFICFSFFVLVNVFAQSVVKIDSAEKTEYKKDEQTGDETVIFTGDVKLSVSKDNNNTYIEADSVIFNRTRSTIFADGNITFKQSKQNGSSNESLTGNALYFNIETMQGVFDDARVVQESSDTINISNGTKLVVSSDLFGKADSETVTFKDGTLTFCEEENPHWKIKASRIWLLPGTEFAFFNASVYIGALPIFYLPFFYYPKNELIFNPVLGLRSREGYYTQTTTYLLGQKTASSQKKDDDGIMSFMKPNEQKKQVRDGLFLKNTTEDFEKSDNIVKIMADAYSNLGFFTGIEGEFKNLGIINDLEAGIYLGFSNTIFQRWNGDYSVFNSLNQKNYEFSEFLGIKLPFRFHTNLSLSISKSPFSFSLELPLYSDLWFTSDFLNRNENMDWIGFLLNGAKEEQTSSSSISSFTWKLQSSISKPAFVANLSPYIENFSISSISSTLNFSSKSNSEIENDLRSYSIRRSFFYPSTIQPLKLNLNISGKLLSLQNSSKKNNFKSNSDFLLPEFLDKIANSEKYEQKQQEEFSKEEDENNAENTLENAEPLETIENVEIQNVTNNSESLAKTTIIDESFVPSIQVNAINSTLINGINYTLSYGLTPNFNSEITLLSEKFTSPKDIDISKISSSFVSVKLPLNLTSSINGFNNFFSIVNTINAEQSFQAHPTLNDEIYPANSSEYQKVLTSDYTAQKTDITNKNTFSFRPFVLVKPIADTSLSVNSSIKLVKSNFVGTAENPLWDYDFAKWDSKHFTNHNMAFSFSTKQQDGAFSQSITLTGNLPPLVNSYTTQVRLKFPFCTDLSASLTYKQQSEDNLAWVFQPFTQNSTWNFFNNKLSISQSFKYNIEEKHSESFAVSVRGFGLTAAFNMSYTNPYALDNDGFWVSKNKKQFLPYDFKLTYSMPETKFKFFYDKISFVPKLNSEIKLDLIQITASYFSITLGFTFNFTDKFSLTFSSVSRNNVMFRYFQNLGNFGIALPGETNVFKDLFNSFAFFNNDLRKASGFKLKQLNITLSHDLHDWTLNSSYTMEPRLIKTVKPYKYQFSSHFTLSVVWNPMKSLKTTIEDKYGEFSLVN